LQAQVARAETEVEAARQSKQRLERQITELLAENTALKAKVVQLKGSCMPCTPCCLCVVCAHRCSSCHVFQEARPEPKHLSVLRSKAKKTCSARRFNFSSASPRLCLQQAPVTRKRQHCVCSCRCVSKCSRSLATAVAIGFAVQCPPCRAAQLFSVHTGALSVDFCASQVLHGVFPCSSLFLPCHAFVLVLFLLSFRVGWDCVVHHTRTPLLFCFVFSCVPGVVAFLFPPTANVDSCHAR